MGLLLSAIGGGLAGLGKGIGDNAIAMREQALEQMKADRADARQTVQEDRLDKRQTEHDTREVQARHDENAATRQFEIGKLGFQAATDRQLVILKSGLAKSEDAAHQQMARDIDSGQVNDVKQAPDGEMLLVYKNGRVEKTGQMMRVPSESANEGPMMTDSERSSAYTAAYDAWKAGGKQGPEPKETDFIGVRASDYRTGQTTPKPTLTAPANAPKPLSPADWGDVKARAGQLLHSGDPRVKGMTNTQVIAMMRKNLEAQGYKVPND